ncbi:unnamed protein product [Dracunculus medinensis]|uniref:Grh/CP2 DB domain-containing protein n=1 Tax=Dracunculus medinensis TaxID=318479 RepID=A0A0N4U1I0_DRAME|nr:unnamed protein product [Dracunculus medinensis]
MAPTSAAVPIYEEPVTFLNQFHPYEIKCRKVDGSLNFSSIFYKVRSQIEVQAFKHMMIVIRAEFTVITVCFENRKARYQMKELIEAWMKRYPGKRFLEIDIAMCSNISNVKYGTRSAEFTWDSSLPNTSIFLRFSVVSSDFIDNAGEKGQPFRLVFQTYPRDFSQCIQQNSSQIQIFKLRGAERKRQTEREKAARLGRQEHFQPAYDYTILLNNSFEYEVENELRIEKSIDESDLLDGQITSSTSYQISNIASNRRNGEILKRKVEKTICEDCLTLPPRKCLLSTEEQSSSRETSVEISPSSNTLYNYSVMETAEWLRLHRFTKYLNIFSDYDGGDLLRLNIDELASLMENRAEAIRLFHIMRKKLPEPRCVLYVCMGISDVYNMIAVHEGTVKELKKNLEQLSKQKLDVLFLRGPKGIKVIQNWSTESVFRISITDKECLIIPQF